MLAPGKIFVNTSLRLTVSFADEDGNAVDPDTVTFRMKSPCCDETTLVYGTDAALSKLSTGNYAADIQPDRGGVWHFRWQTTGTGTTTANEGRFNVQRSAFDGNDCCYPGYWGYC